MAVKRLTDAQREKLKTDGKRRYEAGQTTINGLAREFGVSTPTVAWHLGYRPPEKRRKYPNRSDRSETVPKPAYSNGNGAPIATPVAALTGINDSKAVVIMGTTEQIAEILRGLK